MQILYKTEWPNLQRFRGSRKEQAIAWSRRNIIAFSFGKEELTEDSSLTENEEYSKYLIYYLHPNYPWELYRLDTGYNFPVEHLYWDSSGSQLLGCDTNGHCKIWKVSETLVNKYELKKEFNFNCQIVCVSWLGLESTQAFDAQSNAKDVADKFPQRIVRLPLTDISGQAVEGIIAVTFLGQIFVATLGNDQQCESIQFSNANVNLTHGAVTVTEHGKVSVVVADSEQCVQTFNIVIKKLRGKLSLSLENQPCLVPVKLVDDLSLPFEITKVGFPMPSCSDTVLVCCRNPCGSVVKCFDLCRERISLYPRYQRSVQHLNQLPTVSVWGCSKVMSVTPAIETIGMPRLLQIPLDATRAMPHFSNLTTIAEGNKVARVALPNLVQLDDSNVDLGNSREKIKTVCHSPLDLLCAFVTNKGNIGILLLKRFNEHDERTSFRIATNLMEYSLITGVPSWEIAAAASCYSGVFADRCLSCLREDLADQKNSQEMMFLELLLLEANFYSSMKDSYVVVFECYNALVFKAIRTYIHSVVDSLPSEKDLNLLSRIRSVLDKQSETQISKIAQSLDCSEATENGRVIAEIHFLLQWITDYAIHFARLVATTDFKISLSHLSCFANGILLELQEMLVLIYIWGQRFPSWQPNVVTLGNPLEVLSQIFRMIVKLQSVCNGDNVDLEDIPFKALQLMYLDIPSFDPSGGILAIQQQGQLSPCNIFEFADQDEVNKMAKHAFLGHPLTVGVALNEIKGTLFYDGINCMVLKLLHGETLKQCIQCRLVTLRSCDSGRALNMSWMDRWKRGCICGGNWKPIGT